MKHFSKAEFKRQIVAFHARLTRELEVLKAELQELSKTSGESYLLGERIGRLLALEEIKNQLENDFGLD